MQERSATIMLLLKIVALSVALQVVLGDSAIDKLIRDKKDYVRYADPGNVTLQVGISYVCGDVDRHTHILTSRVFERYTWHDSRLAWNPKDYSGLKKIAIPSEKIWTPDVKLFNSFPESEERDDIDVVILANGTVVWVPPATYTTLCEEHEDDDDHHHYYDCRLQLAPWTHDSVDMPIELFDDGFDTKYYFKSCPYIVKDSDVRIKSRKYDCCPNPFLILEIDLELEHSHTDDDDEEEEETGKKSLWEQHTKKKACFWPHC